MNQGLRELTMRIEVWILNNKEDEHNADPRNLMLPRVDGRRQQVEGTDEGLHKGCAHMWEESAAIGCKVEVLPLLYGRMRSGAARRRAAKCRVRRPATRLCELLLLEAGGREEVTWGCCRRDPRARRTEERRAGCALCLRQVASGLRTGAGFAAGLRNRVLARVKAVTCGLDMGYACKGTGSFLREDQRDLLGVVGTRGDRWVAEG